MLAGTLGAAAAASGVAVSRSSGDPTTPRPRGDRIPFHGPHQAGITTPPQRALAFAAFDVHSNQSEDLRTLLEDWSRTAAELTQGRHAASPSKDDPPRDTGEAAGLSPSRLTITFGLGPSLFDDGRGLIRPERRPNALKELPSFPNDQLDPRRSGGDLAIQACSDDPQVAFQAIHQLAFMARGRASLRWYQSGFSAANSLDASHATPRALIGFKDGTNNLQGSDERSLARHVWVAPGEGAGWLDGGTYMVVRRIRILFDVWDATSLRGQEAAIGRHKSSGAPLGARREHDPAPLSISADGAPVIPVNAHIRVASPEANGGARLLRRGYSFADGVDDQTASFDAGLFFISFQCDPRVFVRIQRQLAASDALGKHVLHVASAVFACPSGIAEGRFVAERMLI